MRRVREYNHMAEWTPDNCYHMTLEEWCAYMSQADNWEAWLHGF